MFKLNVIQAEYGDCLLLEYGGTPQPRYALVDGGPSTVYKNHLRLELQQISEKGGRLDFVALSHIDDDHVKGLLDLMNELCKQKKKGAEPFIKIDTLWHNTFSQTVGGEVEDCYVSMMAEKTTPRQSILETGPSERSLLQGDKLTRAAGILNIKINRGFKANQPISVENAKEPATFGNLELHIIGPTKQNLDKLRQEWEEWLKEQESRDLLAPTDLSVPNLSSLAFYTRADGKTILFTGDGRSDDLISGLKQAGLSDTHGCLHFNIMKVPHHGSARNVSRDYFKVVTADRYIISANGKHDNPDLDTLLWMVDTAYEQGRPIEIIATNATRSTSDLKTQRPASKYGYTLVVMPPEQNAFTIELA